MKVFMNEKNEIKAVGSTTDASLREVEILDEMNPFATWSEEKICCFKANVQDGLVYGYTPYVSTKIIEKLETEARLTSLEETVGILTLDALGF